MFLTGKLFLLLTFLVESRKMKIQLKLHPTLWIWMDRYICGLALVQCQQHLRLPLRLCKRHYQNNLPRQMHS